MTPQIRALLLGRKVRVHVGLARVVCASPVLKHDWESLKCLLHQLSQTSPQTFNDTCLSCSGFLPVKSGHPWSPSLASSCHSLCHQSVNLNDVFQGWSIQIFLKAPHSQGSTTELDSKLFWLEWSLLWCHAAVGNLDTKPCFLGPRTWKFLMKFSDHDVSLLKVFWHSRNWVVRWS